MLFNQLGLSAELLRAVDEKGYQEATPIQQKSIPLILDGCDILAGAQTGTGKTAGFALPLLQRLQFSPHNRRSAHCPADTAAPDRRGGRVPLFRRRQRTPLSQG